MNSLAAAVAAADVDAKAANEGLAGDLGLELFADFGFNKVTLAVRASVGEIGFEILVDLFGPWLDSTGMNAAIVRFTPRWFGFGLGFALAEWCRLPFGLAL